MSFSKQRYTHLIGSNIGAWTILDVFPVQRCDAVRAMCRCRCKCGTERDVLWKFLQSGQSMSCGCVYFPCLAKTYPDLYRKWKNIKARCQCGYGLNKKHYLEKGISVCSEWLHNPKAFIEWALSHGWEKGLEIDRIDNSQGYSPTNCRWVTHKINCRNKTINHLIVYKGESLCITGWAEKLGVKRGKIRSRLRRMSPEETIESIITDITKFPKHLRIRQVPWTKEGAAQ